MPRQPTSHQTLISNILPVYQLYNLHSPPPPCESVKNCVLLFWEEIIKLHILVVIKQNCYWGGTCWSKCWDGPISKFAMTMLFWYYLDVFSMFMFQNILIKLIWIDLWVSFQTNKYSQKDLIKILTDEADICINKKIKFCHSCYCEIIKSCRS